MADSVASSSAGGGNGGARKRVRKRTRTRKSSSHPTTTIGQPDSDTDDADEQPAHIQAATTSNSRPQQTTPAAAKPTQLTTKSVGLGAVNPHKPSFITRARTSGGRRFTVSVAIPGSIVLNAQSPELQSRLAAHIARACAIFNVDEIVVFDEGEVRTESDPYQHRHNRQDRATKRRFNEVQNPHRTQQEGEDGFDEEEQQARDADGGGKGGGFDPHTFLARVLQYLETPQYLRKALFPMHRDLRLAGLMPPLDCPHHLRFEDESEYREGVTVETPHWAHKHSNRPSARGNSVYVNVGLRDPIEAALPSGAQLESGTRVTVRMPTSAYEPGAIVSPREPVEKLGWYWGYTVRLASSLSAVLTACPFSSSADAGYDLVIGTSERGVSLTDLALATSSATPVALPSGETVPPLPTEFRNALIVFGGLSGLELAVEQDPHIQLDRQGAKDLFDAWVNVVENQGSRTVRTEEAIMIALARINPLLEQVALQTGK